MRTQWIAIRTLHSAVKGLDERVEGMQVYALGNHRVVLPPNRHHFRRVIPCLRCGGDMVEHRVPLRHPHDLDQPAHSQLCTRCSQVD